MQHSGYLYDSDYYVDGQPHRIIPYSLKQRWKDGGVDRHRGRLVRLHPMRSICRTGRRDPSEDDVGRPPQSVTGIRPVQWDQAILGLRDGKPDV